MRLIPAILVVISPALAQNQLSSFEAFRKAAVVLRHARCLNCHIPGDQPLNGANGDPHPMLVKRGADGMGTPVVRCASCHQETNGELLHSPPGAKDWKLPPPETRMAWIGLDDQKLCRAILSSRINGGMASDKIVQHLDSDPRVLWAWNPGPGRESPPMAHDEFVDLIRIWIEKGASCAP